MLWRMLSGRAAYVSAAAAASTTASSRSAATRCRLLPHFTASRQQHRHQASHPRSRGATGAAAREAAAQTTAGSSSTMAAAAERQTAYVRYKPEADSLTISLLLAGRQRHLNRPVDEPLEKPLARMRANLAGSAGKQDKRNKKKKKGEQPPPGGEQQQQQQQVEEEPEVFIGLFRDAAGTQLFDVTTPNGQAWPAAALLRVGAQDFDVLVNPPTVDAISLPGFPLVGYPVRPTAALSFAEPHLSRWRWLRRPAGAAAGAKKGAAPASDAAWEDTGCSSICYTPTEADFGCMLRVECTPHAAAAAATGGAAAGTVHGEPATADSGPVERGPEQPAARLRALAPGVLLREPWRFRVMSYNILADQYAGTAYAQQVLFKYCPNRLLDNNYRRQLVLEEVLRYQPDVLCLQEVDDKVFAEFLVPHLAAAGYAGHYTNKQGAVREGSAMFWATSKWGVAALQDVLLRDVFKRPLSPRHAQWNEMLDASKELEHALQKVATIGQMLLLVPRGSAPDGSAAAGDGQDAGGLQHGPPAPLLVMNTHLFFHPFAPHIRTMHTAAMLEEAAAALDDWQAAAAALDGNGAGTTTTSSAAVEPQLLAALPRLPLPTLLFCGDLNSDLNDGVPGVVELLQTGRLAASHWDWKMGATFTWGKDEEEYAAEQQQQQQQPEQQPSGQPAQQQQPGQQQQEQGSSTLAAAAEAASPPAGKDVTVPFVLRSADDLATPFTNYTSGYKALLDYVWYDPRRLTVTRQLPQPAEALLAGFIPSPAFPSDHLAVVYDLAFKPQQPQQQQQQQQAGASQPAAAAAGGPSAHAAGAFTLLPASEEHVRDAVAALRGGSVIALPTDTLYGLAAAADNAGAVTQLRSIKQRSSAAPLAVAVADVADVARYCDAQALLPGLLAALLPGPVTVLLPRRADAQAAPLADGVLTSGGGGGAAVVGVRVVPSEFVRRVCRELGSGIALTSANLSGEASSLAVGDFRGLWQYCGAVFDGGRVPAASNEGSTVVDLTGGPAGFRIVRAGVAGDDVARLLVKSFGLAQLQ